MLIGRPRDEDVTHRILQATLRRMKSDGIAAINYEAIATEAETSRTAIYRRYPSKADLAMDAIALYVQVGEHSHTGSVVKDLTQYAQQNVANQDAALLATDVRNLWHTILNPEILDRYMERVGKLRRELGREIIADGIERGELPPGTNVELILDALAGFVLFRSLIRVAPVQSDEIRAIVVALQHSPPLLAPTSGTDSHAE